MISLLAGLKMSSLAYVNVYSTNWKIMQRQDPKGLNFEGLKMLDSNIRTYRTQRLDETTGDICLVIRFTTRVMVIKISKITEFFNFLLMTSKTQSQFGQNI